ncbi:MAG: CHRD domain-containing protein, partial [Candidatus Krumholzibacteriota bacterium]|nr:CHRD domain-containing protein [Candidatus Krumholzibacteriota bacterium]
MGKRSIVLLALVLVLAMQPLQTAVAQTGLDRDGKTNELMPSRAELERLLPPDFDTDIMAYEQEWAERLETVPSADGLAPAAGGDRAMLGADDSPFHLFYAYLTGNQAVPSHYTIAKGIFLARVDDLYEGLDYRLNLYWIKNLVAAHIHLGAPGENGPVVATLYGPMAPGGGWQKYVAKSGVVTAADLTGPLAGRPLSELIDALANGEAYINVHTNDGVGEDNTGIGDYAAGEIRGNVRFYGTLPEPPAPTTARLQVIHNAADPGAAAVDIYVNGDLLLD